MSDIVKNKKNTSPLPKVEKLDEAIEKFSKYLKDNGHRFTDERISVLKEIYLSDGHFNADEIFIKLKQQNVNISRATVYNTLDLLVKSKLVMHNSFGHKHQHYERLDEKHHHDHIICQQCGEVYEFTDSSIEVKKKEICERFGFKLNSHSLQIFGDCKKENCANKQSVH